MPERPTLAARQDLALVGVLDAAERWYALRVGQALRRELQRRGMSRAQWTRLLGVDDGAYAKKLDRRQRLLVRDLIQIAAFLGTPTGPTIDLDLFMSDQTDLEWTDGPGVRELSDREPGPHRAAKLAEHVGASLSGWVSQQIDTGRGHLLRDREATWAVVEALHRLVSLATSSLGSTATSWRSVSRQTFPLLPSSFLPCRVERSSPHDDR